MRPGLRRLARSTDFARTPRTQENDMDRTKTFGPMLDRLIELSKRASIAEWKAMKAAAMDHTRGVFDSAPFIEASKLAMKEVADCRGTIIYAIHQAIEDEPGDW